MTMLQPPAELPQEAEEGRINKAVLATHPQNCIIAKFVFRSEYKHPAMSYFCSMVCQLQKTWGYSNSAKAAHQLPLKGETPTPSPPFTKGKCNPPPPMHLPKTVQGARMLATV